MGRDSNLPALAFVVAILALPTAAVMSLIDRGWAPNNAATLAIAIATPMFIFAERWRPHAPRWARAIDGDLRTDALYALVLTPPLGGFLLASLSLACLGKLEPLRRSLGEGPWPHHWPILVQALMIGLLADLIYYGWHRLSHQSPFFWRLHSIHHTVPRVYFLNAFRFHPLDSVIGYVLSYAPILLLGASIDAIAVYTVFDFLFGSLQHSNFRVKLGPLNWLFAGPEMHRWHHSRDVRDGNNNYGNTWIVWDVVFGTRHFPKDRAHDPADVGFPGFERYPKGLLGQLIAPFKRQT